MLFKDFNFVLITRFPIMFTIIYIFGIFLEFWCSLWHLFKLGQNVYMKVYGRNIFIFSISRLNKKLQEVSLKLVYVKTAYKWH